MKIQQKFKSAKNAEEYYLLWMIMTGDITRINQTTLKNKLLNNKTTTMKNNAIIIFSLLLFLCANAVMKDDLLNPYRIIVSVLEWVELGLTVIYIYIYNTTKPQRHGKP